MKIYKCFTCKKPCKTSEIGTTGYGLDKHNHKICYKCCAENDKKQMIKDHKIVLYLNTVNQTVSNWPGSLIMSCTMTTGKHNIAGIRHDAWFYFNGGIWHGTQYGYYSDLIYCKQTKKTI